MLALRYIPDAELQVWLRAADVVVLPFRDILTSGSAILALSFGRAVVAPALGCRWTPCCLRHSQGMPR